MLWAQTGLSQSPTFYEDVAPIVYENCTHCHRIGNIGPFPFTNYGEVAAYGHSIANAVATGFMPPWPPDYAYSQFLDQRILTEAEKTTIADWVDAGMPEGDIASNPAIPNFDSIGGLGTPDLEVTMLEPFTQQDDNTDRYIVFSAPTGLSEKRVLKAVEFVPGNNRVVHHAIISLDTTGRAHHLDTLDSPAYGYPSFGGAGFAVSQQGIVKWAPGQRTRPFPDGMGIPFAANSEVIFHIHYGPSLSTETDQSSVRFYFSDEEEYRLIRDKTIRGPHITNPPLEIPANEVKTFFAELPSNKAITVLSVYPHMHFLGKSWKVYAIKPDGLIQRLIRIDNWDFHWQLQYNFRKPAILPAGSIIYAEGTYDNTWGNHDNPNTPPQDVVAGYYSTQEMFWFSFNFVKYRDGDEDLRFTDGNEFIPSQPDETNFFASPNPFRVNSTLQFYIPEELTVTLGIYDYNGKLIKQPIDETILEEGIHQIALFKEDFSEGAYLARLQFGEETRLIRIVRVQ